MKALDLRVVEIAQVEENKADVYTRARTGWNAMMSKRLAVHISACPQSRVDRFVEYDSTWGERRVGVAGTL